MQSSDVARKSVRIHLLRSLSCGLALFVGDELLEQLAVFEFGHACYLTWARWIVVRYGIIGGILSLSVCQSCSLYGYAWCQCLALLMTRDALSC